MSPRYVTPHHLRNGGRLPHSHRCENFEFKDPSLLASSSDFNRNLNVSKRIKFRENSFSGLELRAVRQARRSHCMRL
jgi:hypothetical protein